MTRNSIETFSDLLYANPVGTRQNNCYAWALNYYKNSGDEKLQPGDLAGDTKGVDLSGCDDLVDKALRDAKAMGWDLRYLGASGGQCVPGAYKIVAVVAPGEDFHWYRHHRDLLYRVKTPRSLGQLVAEFGVAPRDVTMPGHPLRAAAGDLVLIRGADVWSHKQGFSPDGPLLRDSCGKIIKDPALACRKYGSGLDYTMVCGTFCFRK
jgi:hypothetical protein